MLAVVGLISLEQGQGIIMLLSGEPGVGKTLTAESGESSHLSTLQTLS